MREGPMSTKKFILALLSLSLMSLAHAETKTVVFQQGLNEYSGCTDKELRDPAKNYGNGPNETILLLNGY
jgi:hypothetical protein